MDRALFIAGTGARELMRRQDVQTNNLANAQTPGFRAEMAAQRTAPVVGGPGLRTRAYAVESTPSADFTQGSLMATGRPLDVAVQGSGWFSVQAQDGSEAYTRGGSFNITADGMLVDSSGRAVLDTMGQMIALPPDTEVVINTNGSISTVSTINGQRVESLLQTTLKLVNPEPQALERGPDGLFRLKAGGPAPIDDTVRVSAGFLESSNVNAIETMVNMIAASRHYDMQVQLMQNIDQNGQAATQILSYS